MSDNKNELAVGVTAFAAIMMVVAGALDMLQGLTAVLKQSFYAVGSQYVWKFDVSTWGWINLILGAVILAAGIALFSGQTWARVVGVIAAIVVAISNFLWLPYYPVWSIIVIAMCVLIIWALTARGSAMKSAI